MNLFTFNGFLGTKQDFQFLDNELPKEVSVHHFSVCDFDQYKNFSEKGEGDYLAGCLQQISSYLGPKVGIGYSLGGRLLLSLVSRSPHLFDAVIFLSTHPGLKTDLEKAARWHSDSHWAEKLKTKSFGEFLKEWNDQPVFKETKSNHNLSVNVLNAQHCLKVLLDYSLAKQADFDSQISLWSFKQVWVAGNRDTKFVELLKRVRGPHVTKKIIEGSGHRLIFDDPKAVTSIVLKLLSL